MSKPRVFVSSTYFDLRHVRRGIEEFIESLGYDAVLFESGDIPFSHLDSLDQSCYREIEACHMLVLIIGGRYGSQVSREKEIDLVVKEKAFLEFNSITKKEYETARQRDIPIYIFLEKGVANEYRTYKENKNSELIKYAHVDSVNIFKLLDDIYFQKRNNLTHEFENIEDITAWLKNQWAGLFGFLLARQSSESQLKSLQSQLSQLKETSDVLKAYTESIMLGTAKPDSEKLIKEMEQKLLKHKIARILSIQPIRFLMERMVTIPPGEVIYQAVLDSDDVRAFISKFEFKNLPDFHKSGEVPQYMVEDYLKLKDHINNDTLEMITDRAPRTRSRIIVHDAAESIVNNQKGEVVEELQKKPKKSRAKLKT